MKLFYFFILFGILGCKNYTINKNSLCLFRVEQDNKIGFIDSTGKIIIPIKYHSGESFSEGLANVREDGYYDYINTEGEYVIAPKFDFAMPFSNGLALVYKDSIPFFINKDGEVAFNSNFKEMTNFKYGVSIVKSHNNKFGLINKNGKLILDTNYNDISEFDGGYFSIYQADSLISKNGVIDSLANFILPLNDRLGECCIESANNKIITSIEDSLRSYNGSKFTIFDLNGNLLFQEKESSNFILENYSKCGRIKALWIESENDYEGFIDIQGNIILEDANIIEVFDYSENKAVIVTKDEEYYFIDLDGKKLKDKKFQEIMQPGFENGLAIVIENGKYGIVDSNINYVVKPVFENISKIGRKGKYFSFTHIDTNIKSKKIGNLYLLKASFDSENNEFNNGILACKVNDLNAYVNLKGEIIWKEKQISNIKELNIDYKLPSEYIVQDLSFDTSYIKSNYYRNYPIPILKSKSNEGFEHLQISVLPNKIDTTMIDSYIGFKISILNNSKKKIIFNAQDGRIHLSMQAKVNNNWIEIQEYYNSWCGNSYGLRELPPGYRWYLIAPKFNGNIKTELRFVLKNFDYVEQYNKEIKGVNNKNIYYSESFEGHINPAQLWRLKYFN